MHSTLDADSPALADPIHILIVEDMKEVALWIARHLAPLRDKFPRANVTIVHTWEDASKVLDVDPAPDVTLLDLGLPDSLIHETIARIDSIEQRSAVVIITGSKAEDVEVMLVERHIQHIEVLEKTRTLGEADGIIRAIVRALLRRSKAEEDRRLSRARQLVKELKACGYGTPEEPA